MNNFISSMFDLSGRTALVTGSSRGIGRAIAETFSRAVLREAACACGGIPVTGDLTDSAGVEALIEQVRNAVPALDILVLNASVQRYVTLDEFDEAEFLREFQANVGAAFRLVQAFAPAMCERKHGRIIIVGSVNQFRPSPRLTVYSATKAALVSLTVNAAKSYAPHGVTVNNLVPGVILTDRNAEALKSDSYRVGGRALHHRHRAACDRRHAFVGMPDFGGKTEICPVGGQILRFRV